MSKARKCLNEARVSADLTDSGRPRYACMVDRKESACVHYARVFANIQKLFVCAHVREDNPRALAGGLSPVRTQNHAITCLVLLLRCLTLNTGVQ